MQKDKKVFVLGLDGANWNLISSWIKTGLLPNFKYLQDNGTCGEQKSQFPPTTFPNWKCYSTGKTPGKLGVFWFEIFDKENKKLSVPNAQSFSGAEIWDYLNKSGISTAVINMPTTFPPKKIDGFMVAGGPLCKDSGYTYPAELEEKLKEKYNYKKSTDHNIESFNENCPAVKEILELVDLRFRVVLDMWNENPDIDFWHLTIFYINVLQHHFYQGEPVLKGWQIIDSYLGKLIQKDVNIFILSDHGCDKVEHVFYINSWLEKEGYLVTEKKWPSKIFKTLSLDRTKISTFLDSMRLKTFMKKLTPRGLIDSIPTQGRRYQKASKQALINWEKTKAFASAQGVVYINIDYSLPEYEKVRSEIIDKLKKLVVPDYKISIAKNVFRGEEVYTGDDVSLFPDVVFAQNKHIHVNGDIGSQKLFDVPQKWSAENIINGMFGAFGPEIKKGFTVKDMSILDLAPTIMHLMDVPIPKDMDGRVKKNIFNDNSKYFKKDIDYQEPMDSEERGEKESFIDEEEVRKQLRGLGYIE